MCVDLFSSLSLGSPAFSDFYDLWNFESLDLCIFGSLDLWISNICWSLFICSSRPSSSHGRIFGLPIKLSEAEFLAHSSTTGLLKLMPIGFFPRFQDPKPQPCALPHCCWMCFSFFWNLSSPYHQKQVQAFHHKCVKICLILCTSLKEWNQKSFDFSFLAKSEIKHIMCKNWVMFNTQIQHLW